MYWNLLLTRGIICTYEYTGVRISQLARVTRKVCALSPPNKMTPNLSLGLARLRDRTSRGELTHVADDGATPGPPRSPCSPGTCRNTAGAAPGHRSPCLHLVWGSGHCWPTGRANCPNRTTLTSPHPRLLWDYLWPCTTVLTTFNTGKHYLIS